MCRSAFRSEIHPRLASSIWGRTLLELRALCKRPPIKVREKKKHEHAQNNNNHPKFTKLKQPFFLSLFGQGPQTRASGTTVSRARARVEVAEISARAAAVTPPPPPPSPTRPALRGSDPGPISPLSLSPTPPRSAGSTPSPRAPFQQGSDSEPPS